MKRLSLHLPIGLIWLFHLTGIVGIYIGFQEWFIPKTPLTLLVCFVLLLITGPVKNMGQAVVIYLFFVCGMFVEWLGVNYGWLFGDYRYGQNLGLKMDGVPFMIGINWAMLVLVTGSIAAKISSSKVVKVIIGAFLMVFLDFFIEPNAPLLDFWYWEGDRIPASNYVGWFSVALVLHWILQTYSRTLNFQFSLNLYLAQVIFFVSFYVYSLL